MSGATAAVSPPVPTSNTGDPHADTAQSTVESLISYLKRRNILWELKLGISASPSRQDTNHVSIVLDGDTAATPIPAITLVGAIYPNKHYVVIFVPPAGHYIIGAIDNGVPRHFAAIQIDDDVDATPTSTGNPIQIGDYTATNLVIDGNEIMARNNGVGSTLGLNNSVGAGNVSIGVSGTNDNINGAVALGNEVFGTVSITPVANTPTSAAITFSSLEGTGGTNAWVSPNTGVPETQVLMFSYSNLSATGVTVWIVRTNTTATLVSWMVKRNQ